MENKLQPETDNSTLFLTLGSITVILITVIMLRNQSLVFALWRLIYLPQAKLLAWLAQYLWFDATKAISLPVVIKATPLAQYTLAFCQAASHFLGQFLNSLFIPLAGGLCYYVDCQADNVDYGKSATGFYRWGNHKPIAEQTVLLTPKAFVTQFQLGCYQVTQLVGLKKRHTLNQLEAQLGCRFTSLIDLARQPYGWLLTTLPTLKPTLNTKTTRHRYDFTVLLDLVAQVKAEGIVPMTVFAPLQATYPVLWAAINSLGRKAVPIECLALITQYRHECQMKIQQTDDTRILRQTSRNLKTSRTYLEQYLNVNRD